MSQEGEFEFSDALNPANWTITGWLWVVVGLYLLLRPEPILSLAVVAFCFPPLNAYSRRADLELWQQLLAYGAVVVIVGVPLMFLEEYLGW